MASLLDLKEHLDRSFLSLRGEWVSGKQKYEAHFASAIGATIQRSRYWDCVWQEIYLELKMGNIWLDLIRYSECLLKKTPESQIQVITLFMKYRAECVTDIYGVTTDKIIKVLNLNFEMAESLLKINEQVPRSLNAQANLTERDVQHIAEFHIY